MLSRMPWVMVGALSKAFVLIEKSHLKVEHKAASELKMN